MNFLVTYRRSLGELISLEQFESGDDQVAEATRRELANKDPDIEIVMLISQSLETLKITHGRYFVTARKDLQPTMR